MQKRQYETMHSRMNNVKRFKGWLPQVSLGPLLNTLSRCFKNTQKYSIIEYIVPMFMQKYSLEDTKKNFHSIEMNWGLLYCTPQTFEQVELAYDLANVKHLVRYRLCHSDELRLVPLEQLMLLDQNLPGYDAS